MEAINNFDLIRPLLKWGEDKYYYVQLILRKKDHDESFGNKNNSARQVTRYFFYSEEEFNKKEKEIIAICEATGARAGITMNRNSDRMSGLMMNKILAERVFSNNFKNINHIVSKVNGKQGSGKGIWLIDIDDKKDLDLVMSLLKHENIKPRGVEDVVIATIPTYTGYHVITTKFHSVNFMKYIKDNKFDVAIHKNNPVALYYPEKQENE